MSKKLHIEVLEKLCKYGIEVAEHFPFKPEVDSYVIIMDRTLIEVSNSNREISLSFHVGTDPDKSALLALMLNKIENVSISIAEMFDKHDESNDLLTGKEAIEHYHSKLRRHIITKYVQEQSDMQYLASTEAPSC